MAHTINLFNQPNNYGCTCKTKYEDCGLDLKDCKEFQFHKKQAEQAAIVRINSHKNKITNANIIK